MTAFVPKGQTGPPGLGLRVVNVGSPVLLTGVGQPSQSLPIYADMLPSDLTLTRVTYVAATGATPDFRLALYLEGALLSDVGGAPMGLDGFVVANYTIVRTGLNSAFVYGQTYSSDGAVVDLRLDVAFDVMGLDWSRTQQLTVQMFSHTSGEAQVFGILAE